MYVPCRGCTLCCQHDIIRLLPEDDPREYHTMPHPLAPGQLALAVNPDGNCTYLGRTGCTWTRKAPASIPGSWTNCTTGCRPIRIPA